MISNEEKSEAVRGIVEWITDRHRTRPDPPKGKATWKSCIAILKCLEHFALTDPVRPVSEADIQKYCGDDIPAWSTRKLVPELRELLKDYRLGPGKQAAIQTILPKHRYILLFELALPRSQSPAPSKFAGDPVNAAEFWRLLIALCGEQQRSASSVVETFWTWVDKDLPGKFHADAAGHFSQLNPNKRKQFIDNLGNHTVDLRDMYSIGDMFDVPRLMFDPLLSRVKEDVVELRLKDGFFLPVAADPYRPDCSQGTYRNPNERLAHSDAAFIQVDLEPDQKTEEHNHPGEELQIVVEGEIDFTLEHSGVRVRLQKNDYVHFYAEQLHSVKAVQKSKLFIIRLYQIEAADTRQQIRQQLENCLIQMHSRVFLELDKTLSPLSLAWIQQLISPRLRKATHVMDKVGFARTLRRIREYRLSQGSLLPIMGKRKEMSRWEEARDDLHAADLQEISDWYGVRRFLLEPYLQPAVPNIVVVRGGEFLDGEMKTGEYNYQIPPRNLAGSDVSIAQLTLPAGGATLGNDHAGFELLVARDGEGFVCYEKDREWCDVARVSKTDEIYAHYSSEKPHRSRNPGPDPATFLVIRFHRDGPRKPAAQA